MIGSCERHAERACYYVGSLGETFEETGANLQEAIEVTLEVDRILAEESILRMPCTYRPAGAGCSRCFSAYVGRDPYLDTALSGQPRGLPRQGIDPM